MRATPPALAAAFALALAACGVPDYQFDAAIRADAGCVPCGATCVVLAADPDHCGACGNACPSVANGLRVCAAGRCGATCTEGFGDCDGVAANGCETVLAGSASHCGACGNACRTGAGQIATCTAGACGARCDDQHGDCDADPTNGCEADLRTSPSHCGRCAMACATMPNTVPTCTNRVCGTRCADGYDDCDGVTTNGCETDIRTSPAHCGRCANRCPAAQPRCVDRACVAM